MGMKFSTGSLSTTIQNFKSLEVAEQTAAIRCLERAGRVWKNAVMENITMNDHTLAQLAALDYPYAKRHGSIRINPDKPYKVHERDGSLTRSLTGKIGSNKREGAFYALRFDLRKGGKVPRFVVHGTRKMLPRDVLTHTGDEPEVVKGMMKAIVKELSKFRSQATIRFSSDTIRFRGSKR